MVAETNASQGMALWLLQASEAIHLCPSSLPTNRGGLLSKPLGQETSLGGLRQACRQGLEDGALVPAHLAVAGMPQHPPRRL